jgi:hypothetical protein
LQRPHLKKKKKRKQLPPKNKKNNKTTTPWRSGRHICPNELLQPLCQVTWGPIRRKRNAKYIFENEVEEAKEACKKQTEIEEENWGIPQVTGLPKERCR